MNIRITGHARGLGRSLYEYFKSLGHNVEGYSLSTGYDINTVEGREQILDGLDNVDVFVNNAWSEYSGQTKLLEQVIQAWDGNKDKKILNISSKACYNYKDINADMERYGQNKREQNKMIEDRIQKYGPHILNVILGMTDTRLGEDFEGEKMDPDAVSKWIADMLLCETMYFQSVTVDASKLDYRFKQ